MKLFTVFGRRVRAHNADCAAGFREDRKHGLIYPSVALDGVDVVPWERASVECWFCVYCGTSEVTS